MAFILKDRVKESTTTTGTGNISLGGALATFDTFQSYLTNGDTTFYAIAHTSSGVDEWEVGLGTWNTGNTLSRTTVLAGSNGTSAVNFSAGAKDIFMTYPASKAIVSGEDAAFANVTVTGTVDGRDIAADGTKLDGVEASADVTDTANVTSAGALMRSGGTMTGNLVLNANPSAALGAATKQYVDTEVSSLVDSAPSTLDTLNELAAALGDDANFSTTVTNSIATKLPLAGGTMTGNLGIGVSPVVNTPLTLQAASGYADTLWLKSVGTNIDSRINIAPTGTGNAQINNTNGTPIEFQTSGVERFRVDNAGDITVKGGRIFINESDNGNTAIGLTRDADEGYVQVYSAGSITTSIRGNGDSYFNGGNVGIGDATPSQKLDVNGNIRVTGGFVEFSGDTSTPSAAAAIHRPADNTLAFSTLNTERMRIDSSGNVIVKAGKELRVNRPDDATYGAISHGAAGTGIVYNDVNGDGHHWQFAGSEKARIDSSGNLLVSKTSTSVSTAGVAISSSQGVRSTVDGNVPVLLNRLSNDGNLIDLRKDGTVIGTLGSNTTSGQTLLDLSATQNFRLLTNGSERIRVNSSGQVGLGTSSMSGELHVSNASDFYTDLDGTDSAIVFEEGGGNAWRIGNKASGDRFNITQSATSLSTNVRFTIDNGGYVGIGTENPSGKLTVYNSSTGGNTRLHVHNDKTGDAAELRLEGKRTTNNDAAQINFANNGNNTAAIRMYSGDDSGELRFYTSAAGSGTSYSEAMRIADDGTVTIGGSTAWHAGNDGSGSGLDADTVDGIQGSSFLRSDTTDTIDGKVNFNYSVSNLNSVSGSDGVTPFKASFQASNRPGTGNYATGLEFVFDDPGARTQLVAGSSGNNDIPHLYTRGEGWGGNNGWHSWYLLWHSGNDGSGSGLDADLLDGVQGSSYLRSDANDTFTGDLTHVGGAVFGAGTLTGDGQNDIFMFGTSPTGITAQGGNYHNKLRILGGAGQSRDLQLYQIDSEYSHIGSSWTNNQLTIDSSFTQVNFNQSVRAPIFYDSNNTSYYVDPADSSLLARLTVSSAGTASTPTLKTINTQSDTFNHAQQNLAPNMTAGESNIIIVGKSADSRNSGYIGYNWAGAANSANYVSFGHWAYDNLVRLYSDGNLTSTGSMRSPIFYDSDNTAYFLNPSATNDSAKFRQHVSIGDGSASANSGSWGARLNLTDGVHSRIDVQQDANSMIGTMYVHTGHAGPRIGSSTAHPMYMMYNGSGVGFWDTNQLKHDSSVRTPIFYDSNDTSYYVDPNSDSRISRLLVGDGSNYIRIGDEGEGANTSYSRIRTDSGGSLYLDAKGSSNIYLGWWSSPASRVFSEMGAQFPIYYDRNDTAYYTNPAGTSALYELTVGGGSPSRTFTIPNTGGTAQWVKLGNFAAGQDGRSVFINVVSNSGYNASDAQNSQVEIRFKTSNNSTSQSGFYGDVQAYKTGPNATPSAVRVVQQSTTSFDIWCSFGTFTGAGSFYTVYENSGTWTHSGTTSTSAPTGTYVDATLNTVWHSGNDGSGSGLDADLWDGNQFSTYLNQSLKTTNAPTFAGATFNGAVDLNGYALTDVGDLTANIMYDRNNTAYYLNPASTSNLVRTDMQELNINGGTRNNSNDATVYITATNNNDWGLIVNKYNSSASEYGLDIRMGSSFSYGFRVLGAGSTVSGISSGQLFHNSSVRGPIFYDSNDTSYYLDPASTGSSVRIKGNIDTRTQNSTTQNNQLYFGINNGNSAGTSNEIGTGITWAPLYTGYTKRSAGILQIGEGNYFRSGLAFYTNNTADATTDWSERMRLDKDGNLIIGQAEISYTSGDNTRLTGSYTSNRLHVNGSIQLTNNGDALVIGRGTASFFTDEEIGFGWGSGWYMTDGSYLRVRNNTSVYSTGSARFGIYYDSNNTSYFFDGSATGDSIRVAGNIVAYYSDERLKDIEGNIDSPLEKVSQLNGFYYTANKKAQTLGYKDNRQVGVSAQEVEAVMPEIVTDAAIGHGYKTVDYAKLVPLLIEAVKEQQDQIETLKSRLEKLEN